MPRNAFKRYLLKPLGMSFLKRTWEVVSYLSYELPLKTFFYLRYAEFEKKIMIT